jgi:hypothetical protein
LPNTLNSAAGDLKEAGKNAILAGREMDDEMRKA